MAQRASDRLLGLSHSNKTQFVIPSAPFVIPSAAFVIPSAAFVIPSAAEESIETRHCEEVPTQRSRTDRNLIRHSSFDILNSIFATRYSALDILSSPPIQS